MKNSSGLAVLLLVVGGGILWLVLGLLGGGADEVSGGRLDLTLEPGVRADLEELEVSAHDDLPADAEGRVEATVDPGLVEARPAAWSGELGGITGRVVEEDGTPVAEIAVALIQADMSLMLAADWQAMGEEVPELIIDDTLTDASGRFLMGGGYDASFQGLGIDLRGPRSTVRVVDSQLHHGELTDIGDVVLRSGCDVYGRVVDESGAPIEGARVRLAVLPPQAMGDSDLVQALKVGLQDFRADSAVGITKLIIEETGSPVIEPPPLIRAHLDDLPLPTTYTDAEGRYRLEGVHVGSLVQAADMAGWLGEMRVIETEHGEVELEDLVLRVGSVVSGVVMDEDGEPLPGIEVMAGVEFDFGEGAILQPAGLSRQDGSFSLSGLPLGKSTMACARRAPGDPWVGALGSMGESLELEFESSFTATVRVVDLGGEPVVGADIKLTPSLGDAMGRGASMFFSRFLNLGVKPGLPRFQESDPGVYLCSEVTPGQYTVEVRAPGYAMARADVELWEGEAEVTLTCETGHKLELKVVDAATREPIARARASIISSRSFAMLTALAVGRTAKDGSVSLGPFALEADQGSSGFRMFSGHQVMVQHPGYADASIELNDDTVVAEVALVRGGELRGRISWGEDPPQNVYMVILENREGVDGVMEAFLPPRIGRSALDGSFRFSNLPPGKFRVQIYQRFFTGDPIELMLKEQAPTLVHRQDDLWVEVGETTEVFVDLSPSGKGQTARITGTVYLDGEPVVDADVRVWGGGPGVRTETDASGFYETPDFLADGERGVSLSITADLEGDRQRTQIYRSRVDVTANSVQRVDVDLYSSIVKVIVTDSSDGSPIAGAELACEGNRATTDSMGEAELSVVGEGDQSLTVSADGYGSLDIHVDWDASDFDGMLEISLEPSVPCAGIADLSSASYTSINTAFLRLWGDGFSDWVHLDEDDLREDGRVAVTVSGAQPGTHKARFWVDGVQGEEFSWDLAEGGDVNLLWVFD